MSKRTPNVFASGRFTLITPFDVKVNNTLDYTCIGIRSFEDFVAEGEADIFARFYEPDGLSESVYNSDVLEKASIITLQSSEGDIIHVPDTYIANYPSASSIGWSRIVFSVDLGAVPDTVVIDHLKTVLANATADTIGVTPNVAINKMATPNSLTQADIDLWVAATSANIQLQQTDYARARDMSTSLQEANAHIAVLSQALIEHGIVVT